MLFDKEFNKFFWITQDGQLACADSTSGDENGVIEGASIVYLDTSIQDVFTQSIGRVVNELLARICQRYAQRTE